MLKKNKLTWLGIFLLIGVEQSIKIMINAFFLNVSFAILPPYFYFMPYFNRYYSWFNSILQIGSSKWIHILFVFIMLILIVLFYRYLWKNYEIGRYFNTMFAFLFSGTVCSLLDKVIWNGSLDYILLNGFFIFDLKDIYIDVFIVLLLLSLFQKKLYKQFHDTNVMKEFFRFVFHKN